MEGRNLVSLSTSSMIGWIGKNGGEWWKLINCFISVFFLFLNPFFYFSNPILFIGRLTMFSGHLKRYISFWRMMGKNLQVGKNCESAKTVSFIMQNNYENVWELFHLQFVNLLRMIYLKLWFNNPHGMTRYCYE